jgi:HPt (histidine-containing phosphotransfer) domain-containing protein
LISESQIKTIFEIDHTGELFRKLLDIFETDIPMHILDLETALKSEQYANAKKISHSIKSSSLNMGATELVDAAANFEVSADQRNGYDPAAIDELQKCFQLTVTELKDYLKLCKPNP